jgi:HAD superfamily hydrolase (TIGR01509 family)
MPSKSIKAIIFDMDGVLVNTEPMHVEIEKNLFASLNLDISDKEHATFLGRSTEAMWNELVFKYNLPYKVDELIQSNKRAIIDFLSSIGEIVLMPGIKSALEKISGMNIPMALASSSDMQTIGIIMSRTGLDKCFIHKLSAETVGKSKPEPDIFLHAAALLGVRPEDCMVVEDSVNGIAAAKAANMICVAYKGSASPEVDQSNADECIADFGQLDAILRKYIA